MQHVWTKPDFELVSVNGECTAYSGTAIAQHELTQASDGVTAAIVLDLPMLELTEAIRPTGCPA